MGPQACSILPLRSWRVLHYLAKMYSEVHQKVGGGPAEAKRPVSAQVLDPGLNWGSCGFPPHVYKGK